MKISVDWLKEFVDLKPPFKDHANALTEAGLEVEAIEKSPSGDIVFQVEVTTNRPDWLSQWGVAREFSAILGLPFAKPKVADENKISRVPPRGWKITSKDTLDVCPYYSGVLIEGITESKVPQFIIRRLESCGLRSINLIVDITNYVMLELGQPLHAFDADLLSGKQILIRRARKKEKLTVISGQQLELSPLDLVIADDSRALALAGVMGGQDSEISDRSRNVFLEVAHFQPSAIRETARRHQISTDSSYRFERRVDPCLVDLTRLRAIELIQKYAKPRHISGAIHCGHKPDPILSTIHFSESDVNEALGCEVKANVTRSILTRLGLDVKATSAKTWKVGVPSFRSDLTRPIDLVEEVARVYGFNKIPELLPTLPPGALQPNPSRKTQMKVRDILVGAGFHEAVSFSFISGDGFLEEELSSMIRLQNPLQSGFEWMRPTLLPGLLQAVEKNIRFGAEAINLFEIANVYRKKNKREASEEKVVGFVICGKNHSGGWLDQPRELTYFDLKGVLMSLLDRLGLNDNVCWAKKLITGLSETVSEEVVLNLKPGGYIGQVSENWLKKFDIGCPVFYGELKIDVLSKGVKNIKKFSDVSRFPAMRRDLSITIPESVLCYQVITDIQDVGGELVKDIELFDLYQGGRVEKGYRNLSFRLTYLSAEKTLTSEEIDLLHSKIAKTLASKYEAQFQSK